MNERYHVAVVGGGIVGLATAYRLLERRPGLRLAVVEKEADLALHQTARNSGVLHAGLYYRPGSLKARLCREGKADLERFCEAHDIPIQRPGKLVVAARRDELPRLDALRDRGAANGIRGLEEVGPERIRDLEPHVTGVRGLHVPETGIVDFRRVALALADELRARGAEILLGHRVTAITVPRGAGTVLQTTLGPVLAANAVTCAGLQSDRVAAMTGAGGRGRIVPFRGDYCVLRPRARHLVRGLIYPVPDPALPFLGVHLTRRIDGEVWAGPNAVLAFAREGYRRWQVDPRDLAAALGYRGLRRLARRHWRAGLEEIGRDLSKRAFVAACRRYVPELRAADVRWGPSGIRAQAVEPDGTLLDDFSVDDGERVLHVRNAPSPAATACLAIGSMLAHRAAERFALD
ncbi:MAG TPA: L-2-hydroxyglutarate oxidase [Actinomycetota bacterium]